MRPHQLFRRIPHEHATGIFQFLRDEERDIYKSTLATLAMKRKLRPVFMQKRPVDKQIGWMIDTVKIRDVNDVAEQIFQVWLMKSRQEILTGFLDEMKIEHDGEGAVEGDLPDELDAKKLKAAVDKLLKKHDAADVAIYLHVFDGQRPNGWPELKEMLENDARLKLGDDDAAEEKPVEASPPAEEPAPAAAPAEPAPAKVAPAPEEEVAAAEDAGEA